MHSKYPILGGLALGLVLLAATAIAAGGAAEYSGANLPGLASLDTPAPPLDNSGRVKLAQSNSGSSAGAPSNNDAAAAEVRKKPKKEASSDDAAAAEAKKRAKKETSNDDAAVAEARKRLKKEIDRSRAGAREEKDDSQSGTHKSAKKEPAQAGGAETPRPQPAKQPVPAIDPEINRAAGKLIMMHFSGSAPSDSGPKAIRALAQNGLIAGVVFRTENIQSKGQLKELMKFLREAQAEPRLAFAISEIGGSGGGLPRIKDFEAWPSEQRVASQGDPEYAYSTYRSLGSYLAGLGFTMNFGPTLGIPGAGREASASFGDNALQAGVFAKTFLLGHKDDNIIAIPVVDSSDAAVRAVKTLLVSYPAMPVAAASPGDSQPFAAYDGLVRGARFCMVTLAERSKASEAAANFTRGCDVLVIDAGKESPATIRDLVVQGVSDIIKSGSLTLAALEASGAKLAALRSPSLPSPKDGFTARTAQ